MAGFTLKLRDARVRADPAGIAKIATFLIATLIVTPTGRAVVGSTATNGELSRSLSNCSPDRYRLGLASARRTSHRARPIVLLEPVVPELSSDATARPVRPVARTHGT